MYYNNYFNIMLRLKYLIFVVYLIVNYSNSVFCQDTTLISILLDSSKLIENKDARQSLKFAQKAFYIADKHNIIEKKIDALNRITFIYIDDIINYDSVYIYMKQVSDLLISNDYKKGKCQYYYLKALYLITIFNHQLAKDYLHKSLKFAKEIGDKKSIANAQYTLGNRILPNENKFSEAIAYLNLALNNYKEYGDTNRMASCFIGKGLVYLHQSNMDSSLYMFEKASDIYSNLQDTVFYKVCTYFKAFVWFNQGKYKNAEPIFYNFSLLSTKNKRLLQLKYLSISHLSYMYGEMGKFDKAYLLQRKYQTYADSAYSFDNSYRINNLLFRHETELAEKEKNILKAKNEIQKLELKQKKYTIWFILFISVQLFFLVFIMYKKYKNSIKTGNELRAKQQLIFEQEKEIERRTKEKIKLNLEYKKRELASKAIQIYQVNKHTENTVSKLKNLKYKIRSKGKVGDELKEYIQSIINEIHFSSNVQIWDEFEMYFNKVTPGFKKWLTNSFPSLTANEIRLCIFSQLNLKPKEISNITLQSIKSINAARIRLRKKLGIDNPQLSISSFLLCQFKEYQDEIGQN